MTDTSMLSDLMISTMNLIEQEIHAHYSWEITKDKKWLDIKEKVHEIRARQMEILVKEGNDQGWCFSKHCLSSIMRSIEVGDKICREGSKDDGIKFYEDASKLLEIFYNLNFKEEPKFLDKLKNSLKL